ncbi:hypothetical protein FVE85_2986 [Porphyridium purpureum]|uniref:NAD-dependent epimerase/dehydratase domain-containing protein n=1 Tax=Porphyridium purpureum TaxID=35688 RepID=A0A5J4YU27_PORPP|nr:hypothetical protein FVE85_2986 [Porphyridium purpureum]|eukprot:POR6196..scf227_4
MRALHADASFASVFGTCRDETKARQLSEASAGTYTKVFVFDSSSQETQAARDLELDAIVRDADLIVSAVPPLLDGLDVDPVISRYRDAIFDCACRSPSKRKCVVYLSSTSVYGDHDGAWVDESSETRPISRKAKRRLAAEAMWMSEAAKLGSAGCSVFILRLAGIYGPGRNIIASILSGRTFGTSEGSQDKPVSRIHVDDIVQSVLRISTAPMNSHDGSTVATIINVADDEPATTASVRAYAANLLQSAGFEVGTDSKSAWTSTRDATRESKRVLNSRLCSDYSVKLKYATFREGLAHVVQNMQRADPS